MTRDNMLKMVNQQLEAYNRGDLDGFCQCYHSEVVVRFLISDRVASEAMDAFRERYRLMFSSSPQLNCELKNRIVLDTAVIDEEWVTGAKTFPEGLHTTAIYGFKDGLINRVWFAR
jgi:hypothetical protein